MRAGKSEILNHFVSRLTNGYAEGITNKIKVIKRRAYGCPNFQSFRAKGVVGMRLIMGVSGGRVKEVNPYSFAKSRFIYLSRKR